MTHNPDRIPMRELERLTGFPRATILYYIKEGLLPEGEKTARNMAYYDSRFVANLWLIRTLKEQFKLSLPQIKELLHNKGNGIDLNLLLEVRNRLFKRLSTGIDQPPFKRQELLEKSGLSEEQLTFMEESQLVYPQYYGSEQENQQKIYHPDSLLVIRLVQQFTQLGIPNDALKEINAAIQNLIRVEMTVFSQNITLPMLRDVEFSIMFNTVQKTIELSQSLISLLHLHALYHQIGNDDNITESVKKTFAEWVLSTQSGEEIQS